MQEMKEKYLERYLEEEYQIKIERKHKAYIVISKNDVLIDFFYDMQSLYNFLLTNPDFNKIAQSNGYTGKKVSGPVILNEKQITKK